MMGGIGAHEYMAPCAAGENDVALAPGYAANVEVATRRRRSRSSCRRALDAPRGGRHAGPDDDRRRSPSALGVPAGRAAQGLSRSSSSDDGLRARARARRPPRQRDQARATRSARRSGPRSEDEFAERIGPAGFIGPVGADVPILLDDARRPAAATSPAPTEPDAHLRGVEPGPRLRRSSAPTCARVEAGDTVDGARDPDRARDRGRQHLQARHALLRAARRDLPRRGRHASSRSGWAPTASARRASPPPRSSSSPTSRASPGRARSRRSTSAGRRSASRAREERELAERLYDELRDAGLDVLYDDRDAGPGEKFADAELLGVPAAADGRPAHARGGRARGAGPARAARRARVPLEGAAEAAARAVARRSRRERSSG